MRFLHDGHEARRVDVQDYDGMCALVSWCGGEAIDDGEYVITVPIPDGAIRVKDHDWVFRDGTTGLFHVLRDPGWRPMRDPWPWFLTPAA